MLREVTDMYFHPLQDRSLRSVTPAGLAGRARPARRTPPAAPCAGVARMTQIRQRVRDGFYASPAAVEALAGCLLFTGVIEPD